MPAIRNIPALVATWVILGYRAISPLWGTTACCIYELSCSEYALWQFKTQPFFTAVHNTLKRIWSCRPRK